MPLSESTFLINELEENINLLFLDLKGQNLVCKFIITNWTFVSYQKNHNNFTVFLFIYR